MDETDFKLRNLKVQLGQFSTTADSKHVFVGKIIKFFSDFWNQRYLERSFFPMEHIKSFPETPQLGRG